MFLLSTKPLQSARRFTRKRCLWTVYIPFEFDWLWIDLSIEVAGRSDRETMKTVHIININLINDRHYYYFTDHIKFLEEKQAHLQSCVNKLYFYKHVFKKHSHDIRYLVSHTGPDISRDIWNENCDSMKQWWFDLIQNINHKLKFDWCSYILA